VPPQSLDLAISGMTCAACATRIETVLNKLPGVEANVNFASEKANIRFVPGQADAASLIAAVRRAGYDARESGLDTRAAEKARKAAAYRAELKRFWISVVLTLPLVAQMGAMFTGEHEDWLPRWLQFAAGHAGAVLDRLALLRRRLQCPARRRRQHGRAGGARHLDGLAVQRRGDGGSTCTTSMSTSRPRRWSSPWC
jgi:cation transport ATPase